LSISKLRARGEGRGRGRDRVRVTDRVGRGRGGDWAVVHRLADGGGGGVRDERGPGGWMEGLVSSSMKRSLGR
jgi:hypothetical protein